MLFELLAALSTATPIPAESPLAPAPQTLSPQWLHRPSADNLMAVIPAATKQGLVPGRTAMRCFVDDSGRLDSCVILADEPDGAGYGGAALNVAKYFRLKLGVGGAAPGSVVLLKIDFCMPDDCPTGINIWPGDSAYAVRRQPGKPRTGETVFPCPSPTDVQRTCVMKRFRWKQRPDQQKLIDAVATTDQTDGHSLMECAPADGGRLKDCKVEHATAKSGAILLALSSDFQIPDAASDKTPMAGAKILFDIDWGMAHRMLYPHDDRDLVAPSSAPPH